MIPVVAGGGGDSIAIGRNDVRQCSARGGGSDRKRGMAMEANDKSQKLK